MKKETKKIFFLKKRYKRTWRGVDKNIKELDLTEIKKAVRYYLINKGYKDYTYRVSVSSADYYARDNRYRIYFRINTPTYSRPYESKTTFIQSDRDGFISEEKLLSKMKEVVEGEKLYKKLQKELENKENQEKIFLERINNSLKENGLDIEVDKGRYGFNLICSESELEKLINQLNKNTISV